MGNDSDDDSFVDIEKDKTTGILLLKEVEVILSYLSLRN
jgi:hypothetical protein